MPKSLNTEQNRLKFCISIDQAIICNVKLKLDLFSWASLSHQPRSQGLVPILSAGREKALASAGHVPT